MLTGNYGIERVKDKSPHLTEQRAHDAGTVEAAAAGAGAAAGPVPGRGRAARAVAGQRRQVGRACKQRDMEIRQEVGLHGPCW